MHQDAQGHHLENIQELLSHQVWHANGAVSIHSSRARRRALLSLHHQVVIAEMLAMTLTLQEGGTFVVKCFDTFSDLSASLIYTLCLVFRHVTVVKPFRSRSVNSERYLVAKDLVSRDSPAFHGVAAALQRAYDTCLGNPDVSPQSLLPVEVRRQEVVAAGCLLRRQRGVTDTSCDSHTGPGSGRDVCKVPAGHQRAHRHAPDGVADGAYGCTLTLLSRAQSLPPRI